MLRINPIYDNINSNICAEDPVSSQSKGFSRMSIHSKISFGMLLVLFSSILNGCNPSHPSPIIATTPTAPSIYTSTYTPTPTQTQTQTSTPDPVMSTGNADRIAELARLGKGMMGKAIWSPDGKFILVPYSTGIYRFDSASLAELTPVETTTPANSIAFSPDGMMLASTIGQNDNSICYGTSRMESFCAQLSDPLKRYPDPRAKKGLMKAVSGKSNFRQTEHCSRHWVFEMAISTFGMSLMGPSFKPLRIGRGLKASFFRPMVNYCSVTIATELSGCIRSPMEN